MSSSFNRQFMMLDFRLLMNREFLRFLGSSEFATYLVLRRYIWRGEDEHYMGLHELYRQRKLASSLTREKIAEITGVSPDNISRHLTSMVRKGILERQRTGRQSIYVLGEWVDVKGDGSYRLEWFYVDGLFGLSKADLTKSSDPTRRSATGQTLRRAADSNREGNREEKTVANGDLRKLPNLEIPRDEAEYIASDILDELGDRHSANFYRLVATKVPEPIIRRALSEIRADGADSPAKVFTHRMKAFAREVAPHASQSHRS